MKTWTLQGFGIDNLKPVERDIPVPGPTQLLVKVNAVSLNYRDKAVIEKMYLPELMHMPLIAVSDAAGVVAATGKSVTRFATGDRVISHLYPTWVQGLKQPADVSVHALGGPRDGGLAEYMLLEEEGAVATPAHLSDEEAATLPIAALTAWFALVDHGHLQGGQTVLVQGTGGVSLFGMQLANALGARVILLSGSDEKLARAKELGAWETIHYGRVPDWHQHVLALTEGQGVDNILNIAGGSSLNKSVQAAAIGGQISVIGFLESPVASLDLIPAIFKAVQVRGILVGNRKAFEAMNAVITQHRIRPVIDTIYPFADTLLAYKHLDRGAFGKIVIRTGD